MDLLFPVPTIAGCLALLALSCGSSTPEPSLSPEPLPIALAASASVLIDNALIVRISGELDSKGHVYVEYWSEGVDRLRSRPFASTGTAFEAYGVRLRAATVYAYQVFVTDSDGRRSREGPKGTFTTGALPDGLAAARFNVRGGAPTLDLTFLEFRQHEFVGLAAFDGEGHVVWYFEPPEGEQPYVMDQRADGNIVYVAGFKGGTTALGLVEITPVGTEVARYMDDCNGFGPIHHEVQALQDGRVLYLSREVLWEGYEGRPAPQEGDTVGIWDPVTGEAEIVWNIFDFISPTERVEPHSNYRLPGHPLWGGCDRDRSVEDWSHGNSAVMSEDGGVLVSLGHLNQVVLIAPDLQSLRWRLGGPGSDFTFLRDRDRFYAQHSAISLPNGNVLLFDNGNRRPDSEGGQFSRALELELDLDEMTATTVWEYRYTQPLFAICCSSVQRLENGNTVVMFGSMFADKCCRIYVIAEVDGAGRTLWEVRHVSPGKQNQYRVYAAESIMGERRLAPPVE
jgi:hypothetical protein